MTIKFGSSPPGSPHDQLVVAGPATLDGALQVAYLNGFTPALDQEFRVLSYGSRSGNFSSVVQPGLPLVWR
ncbi:MAG: hypothetical protein KIS67_16380 [Verrucomicrobiae bacterium]|nr:hypothetical protein [Verrucomicrobiae bacterium]